MENKTIYSLQLFPDGHCWALEVGNKKGYKTLNNARRAAKKALENYNNGGLAFVMIRKENFYHGVMISSPLETINKYS